ncbi:MAG: penicillin-binding protein activator [Proteobacteria bacterium]|nr:penicillin-binding protein activator [Pseudomonadota bacterium]MDA0926869.1 penicillin-binding protein activator [Pseudomonadota bacterium]
MKHLFPAQLPTVPSFPERAIRRLRITLALLLLPVLITACSSTPGDDAATEPAMESTSVSVDQLLTEAESLPTPERNELLLQGVEELLATAELQAASVVLESLGQPDRLLPQQRLRYALLQAGLAQRRSNPGAALRWLEGSLTSAADPTTELGAIYFDTLGRLYEQGNRLAEAVSAYAEASAYYVNDASSDIFDRIWLALQNLSDSSLNQLAADASSYELRGWIELERVYRDDEFSLSSQLDAIARWQTIWSSHPATQRLPTALAELRETWERRPRHIALVLPLNQAAGLAIQEGFLSAYYQALAENRNQPQVTVLDSSGTSDVMEIYDLASDHGADLMIGPLSKSLVNQLQGMDRLPITTLALNYLDNPGQLPRNLYQFGLAPEDEIDQAAQFAWLEGHRNVALVTPQSQDYLRLQGVFRSAWEALGGSVVSAASYSETNDYSDVVKRLMAIDSSEARAQRLLDLLPRNSMEFTPRRRQDIDFIFLIANPRQGRLIKPTLAFYFAEDVPVYALPSIFDGQQSQNDNRDLDGIWFTAEPWLLSTDDELKASINANLRTTLAPLQRLRALGIDSFGLYARLGMLSSGQLDSIFGTTGRLTVEQNGRIRRGLQVARFINGTAVVQTDSSVASDD